MMLALYPGQDLVAAVRHVDPLATGLSLPGPPEYDILLRGVFFENDEAGKVSIESVEFALLSQGRQVRKVVYGPEAIESRMRRCVTEIARQPEPLLVYLFGGYVPFELDQLCASRVLEANQGGGLMFEAFRIHSEHPVDELSLRITFEGAQGPGTVEAIASVEVRQNEVPLRFPLTGNSWILGAYDNLNVTAHRRIQSQEFALDIVGFDGAGEFHPADRANTGYACYGREVLAAAEGVVRRICGQFPENSRAGEGFSVDELVALTEEHGSFAALVGNHVVLEHESGEASLYGHLMPGSLDVSLGQTVRAGQRVGKVGNSGMSPAPHLHFSLMDGPDPVGAQGIPCRFSNIVNVYTGQPEHAILESYWFVSAQ